MTRRKSGISIPSWFWQDYFKDTIGDSPEAKRFQKMADKARNHLERTNERIRDIRRNPEATDAARSVQVERVARSAKQEFESMINGFSLEIAEEIGEISGEIKKSITSADKISAVETRQRLAGMKPGERASFIRRLQEAGDLESLAHVLGRSSAYLGIDSEDYELAKQAYINGKFPEKSKRLKMLKKANSHLKLGLMAAIPDFDEFKSGATKRAERAKKALQE